MSGQAVLQDLNDLYLFSVVAEHGGFSAAERALGIPKSRLSARVAILEQRLGVRLFQRTTRHVSLTEVGTRFLVHCQASITEALAAQNVIDLASASPSGLVRISCPILATQTYIAPCLPQFMQAYPQVRVQMMATDRPVDLLNESIDIAIRLRQPDQMDSELVTKPLGISRRFLVASPDYLKHLPPLSHPDDLHLAATLGAESRDEIQEWELINTEQEHVIVRHQPILMCSDHQTLLQAAVQGLGVAMLPDVLLLPALTQGHLNVVLPGWSPPELVLHLVFPTRRGMLPSVRALIDYLCENIQQMGIASNS
ncbi:LysR substrate-binding domain-containing protein [Pseudomonas sp. MRSN 12121]|uniref:LysR substrate-binding domain-containing protein n=1 Tax=Pseudomonas sp. MRSN 12121 TaxID=1611770 RepID=UPI0005BEBD4A|nr:LysR substrate-binding domain-containing protein [Pseudomonas sp. MRSN 12121]AJO77935.1 LysR family transcriptional regulator [Pseudomonas sp. MRSN 12121]